jgi:hypothetical protein
VPIPVFWLIVGAYTGVLADSGPLEEDIEAQLSSLGLLRVLLKKEQPSMVY